MESCDTPQAHGVRDFFGLLSKAHMLDVLHYLVEQTDGPVRFVEIQNQLGLSPNTLTARLKDLAKAGFVERTAYNEIPPRVDYQATERAKGLCTVFAALAEWADVHGAITDPATAPPDQTTHDDPTNAPAPVAPRPGGSAAHAP